MSIRLVSSESIDDVEQGTEEAPATETAAAETPPAVKSATAATDPDLSQLFKLRDRVRELEAREYQAHENYKVAKKNRESAQAEVDDYIDEMRQPTLFNVDALPRPEAAKPAEAQDDESDDWKATTTAELGLPVPIVTLLDAHNPAIRTLGDIADFTASGGQLTDIKGIGEAKATKIEDACNAFWGRYGRPAESGVSEESAEDATNAE